MHARMSLTTALRAIDEAVDQHPNMDINVLFMGGEPILSLGLIQDIVTTCREKYNGIAFHFKIVSNGTLIHKKEQEWINANSDIVEVTLSIDGDRETHNLHRCKSYDLIDYDYWEHSYPNLPTINMVVTPETIGKMASNVIKYEKRGYYIKTILADGVKWNLEKDIPIFERELNTLIEHYVANPDLYPTSCLTIPIYALNSKYALSPCEPGHNSICIMPDGTKVPCYRCSPFFGDNDGYILNELCTKKIEDITAREVCKDCSVRRLCNACPAQVAGLRRNIESAEQYCAIEKTLLRANAYAMTQFLLYQPNCSYLKNMSGEQKKDIITNSIFILKKLHL